MPATGRTVAGFVLCLYGVRCWPRLFAVWRNCLRFVPRAYCCSLNEPSWFDAGAAPSMASLVAIRTRHLLTICVDCYTDRRSSIYGRQLAAGNFIVDLKRSTYKRSTDRPTYHPENFAAYGALIVDNIARLLLG